MRLSDETLTDDMFFLDGFHPNNAGYDVLADAYNVGSDVFIDFDFGGIVRIDPATGELWEAEHGPKGGYEINLIRPGKNYGWPVITYGMNYDGTPITS